MDLALADSQYSNTHEVKQYREYFESPNFENTLLRSMRRKRMYSGDQGVTVLVEHLSQKD
jgi:hypothetical protein